MPTPILSPSGYAATRALAFADPDGNAVIASAALPLPVTLGWDPTVPLTGTTTVGGSFGPYQPALGRDVMLGLSGSWTGSVRVMRSVDGGLTRVPLTMAGTTWGQYAANCCEPVWQESEAIARLYLDVTLSGGVLSYRLAQ